MAAISATGLCRPPGVARVDFPLFVRNFPLDERTGGGGGGGLLGGGWWQCVGFAGGQAGAVSPQRPCRRPQ